MHELSLLESLKEQIEKEILKGNFKEILEVRVLVGLLSGVNVDSLQFGFPVICQGPLWERTKLTVEIQNIEPCCQACGHVWETTELDSYLCPKCQSLDIKILKGKEFLILDLNVIENNHCEKNQ